MVVHEEGVGDGDRARNANDEERAVNKRALRVSGKDVAAALRRNGWEFVHSKGGHMQLEHPERSGKVTIPIHGTTILLPKTLKSILEQSGITEDELRDML